MSKRVAYIFKGCEVAEGFEELQHLDNNVLMITDVLQEKGAWDVTPFELDNADTLKHALSTIMEAEDIDEFLFYYTGHGKGTNESYYLIGEEESRINLLDAFALHDTYTQKVSVIIDACESHTLIEKWNNDIPYELFVATKNGLAYEGNLGDMSDFSYCFYEAFKTISKETFRLEDIHEHMKGKLPKQESDYMPIKSRPRSIIGYSQDNLLIRNNLSEKNIDKLREDSLMYIDKNMILRDNILEADSKQILINEIFKDKQCLYCLTKAYDIETSYFNETDNFNCQQLKDERKVISILTILNTETKEKIDDMMFKMSIYYQYEDSSYEHYEDAYKQLKSIDFYLGNAYRNKKYKSKQVEFIFMVPDEILIENENKLSALKLHANSLQKNREILTMGDISYKILKRYKFLEEFKGFWEDNSNLFIQNLTNDISSYLHKENCIKFSCNDNILQCVPITFTKEMVINHIANGICASLYDTEAIDWTPKNAKNEKTPIKVFNMKSHIFKHLKSHSKSFFICDRYDEKVIDIYNKSIKPNINNNTTQGENYVHNG